MLLLTVSVGLPFFCVSASAPVLQAWFAHCGGRSAKDPYFLYAASNLGSLAGLAAYPLLIEPRLPLALQTQWWTAGYGLLVVLFGLCAAALWTAGRRPAAVAGPTAVTVAEDAARSENDAALPAGFHAPVTLPRRLRWLALALVPSALLMGITAHLSVDIASVPLLWAIPLGLYLLSFIMVFARWPILKWLWLLRIFQAAALVGAAATVYRGGLLTHGIVVVGALHLTAFFLTALVCHGAMAADRPASKYLTEFYLWMSAGGVLGGLICALAAPLVFNSVLEYPRDGDRIAYHTLMHGSTIHGRQSCDPNDALEPWTYYHRSGPVGDVFDVLEHRAAFVHGGHIGVVGLGTGSLAAYAKPGQDLTYFEIDGVVRRIATTSRIWQIAACRRRSAWAMPG